MTTFKYLLVCGLLPSMFAITAHAELATGKTKRLGNIGKTANDTSYTTYWNQMTPENAGKWGEVESTRDVMNWSTMDVLYNYAQSRGIPFKAHNLVWGIQQPAWISSLPAAEQKEEVEEWIRLFCQRYPNVYAIDVVNEPVNKPAGYRVALGGAGTSGYDWIVWTFEKARQYAPNAKLLLNEYDVEKNPAKMASYIKIVRVLKQRGLIDGVGLQGHFLETSSLSTVRTNVERLAAEGVPLYVSEFDINKTNDNDQLAIYQNLFPFLWEHPMVREVTLWGYKQNDIWQAQAYLLRSNATERPALSWLRTYVASVGEGADLPAKPLNLTASTASINSINLSWEDESNNESSFVVQMREEHELSYRTLPPVPANSTSLTVNSLAEATRYEFRIRSANANGISWWSNSSSATTPGSKVLVDNTDTTGVTITGSWTASDRVYGFAGINFLHDGNAEKGVKSVRFTPVLPSPGIYKVFIRWFGDSTYGSNIPIDVAYTGGVDRVQVDQRNNSGEWVLLGTYNFAAGSSGSVLVSNAGTTGFVSADAVKFVSTVSGILTVASPEIASGSYNFTTLGTLDWIAWGRASVAGVDRKITGGSKISNWAAVGTGHSRTYNSSVLQTWTDGNPTASATSSGYLRVGGLGRGFELSASATTSLRTLKLYTAIQYGGTGELEASLDDGSAAPQTITISGGGGLDNQIISIQYKAAGNSQLRLRWLNATGLGNIALRGAYLQ